MHRRLRHEPGDLGDVASPISYAEPFLILDGERDPSVSYQQSVHLYEALTNVGAKNDLRVVRGAGHGGANFPAWRDEPR